MQFHNWDTKRQGRFFVDRFDTGTYRLDPKDMSIKNFPANTVLPEKYAID